MKKLKRNEGITLIALVVTILVLLILAGISIMEGTKVIRRAKMESFVTNMLTIKSKTKGYAEEIESKTWNLNDNGQRRNELFAQEYGMTVDDTLTNNQKEDLDIELNENDEYIGYLLSSNTLEDIGLDGIKNDTNYVVVFNSNDFTKMDVIYKAGIEYKDTTYYTLSKLKEAIEEEDE